VAAMYGVTLPGSVAIDHEKSGSTFLAIIRFTRVSSEASIFS
jgi:hypothetical protein